MLDKKGFLFTVTVFLILTYILLSISVWVKSVETSERSFADFYKQSTIELAIEQITPEKMGNVSSIIMNRALNRLNEHTIDHPIYAGPSGNENKYIRTTMFSLLMNGSASGIYFVGLSDTITQEENSSFKSWVYNLNSSLAAIGVYISDFSVYDFNLTQDDIDLINYSFTINLSMKDFANTTSVSRVYYIDNQLDITGLVDPALARTSIDEAGDALAVYRMFFFNKNYSDPSDITINSIPGSIYGGQGWVYGYLADANSSHNYNLIPYAVNVNESERHLYILYGTYSELEALSYDIFEDFGGYIVTTKPGNPSNCTSGSTTYENEDETLNPIEYTGGSCTPELASGADVIYTSKPFIVSHGFNSLNAEECPIFDGSNSSGRCVLFLNNYGPEDVATLPSRKLLTSDAGLYSIEELRDFVMCGYYTHSPDGPSYFQRLMVNSYTRNSTEFGLETFVIGIYANDTSVYDTQSRLDRELYIAGVQTKIRGLPGCKNYAACSDSPKTGIFAASASVISSYGLDDIACDVGAGCD
ncbi:MAG: hypothetical protein ABH842_05280 [Candidatus Micrarchaeota archaeon]